LEDRNSSCNSGEDRDGTRGQQALQAVVQAKSSSKQQVEAEQVGRVCSRC